jgi:hypothetical protein
MVVTDLEAFIGKCCFVPFVDANVTIRHFPMTACGKGKNETQNLLRRWEL